MSRCKRESKTTLMVLRVAVKYNVYYALLGDPSYYDLISIAYVRILVFIMEA